MKKSYKSNFKIKTTGKGYGKGAGGSAPSKKTWFLIGGIALAVIAAIILTVVLLGQGGKTPDPTPDPNAISYITVATYPELTYFVGDEEPTFEGLSINVIRTNNTTLNVVYGADSGITLTGFDSSEAVEEQTITVSYQGYTCTFTVRIDKVPEMTVVPTSIEMVILPKTEYTWEEWTTQGLDLGEGAFRCYYSNETYMDVGLTPFNVDLSSVTAPGTYEIPVEYTEEGVTLTTTFTITITE